MGKMKNFQDSGNLSTNCLDRTAVEWTQSARAHAWARTLKGFKSLYCTAACTAPGTLHTLGDRGPGRQRGRGVGARLCCARVIKAAVKEVHDGLQVARKVHEQGVLAEQAQYVLWGQEVRVRTLLLWRGACPYQQARAYAKLSSGGCAILAPARVLCGVMDERV